jgi:hypothetical protein
MNKLFLKLRIWRLENKLQNTCENYQYHYCAMNSCTWKSELKEHVAIAGKLKIRKEFLTQKLERLKSQLNEIH